jgi:MarR family transcriptional regulator, organic hydroperoxide resistance regulator
MPELDVLTEETKEPVEGHPDLWLFELAPRVARLQDMVLRDLRPSITFGQFRLLQRVAEGRSTLTEISQASTLSLPTLSERIEGSVKKGLIRRKASPSDRRASLLVLTKLGKASIAEASQRLQMLHDWMFNPMGSDVTLSIRENCLNLDHRLIALLKQVESGEKTLSEVVLSNVDSTSATRSSA